MQNVMFIGWNAPKNGREAQAGELFGSFINMLGQYQQKGQITSFEPCLLASHGGDMNGFFLVKGEPSKLDQIRNSEEFTKIVMQSGYAIDGFGVIGGFTGDNLMQLMGEWTKMVS